MPVKQSSRGVGTTGWFVGLEFRERVGETEVKNEKIGSSQHTTFIQ